MREKIGKRIPSYDELLKAAQDVGAIVDDGERVAIAGGLAMQIWGSSRLTSDLDVLSDSCLGYEGELLSFGGIRTREGDVDLDIIVREDEWQELYDDALEKAEQVEGILLPVVTPEFLVPIKMVAGRAKDESDVRYLVLTSGFDQPETERIVRKHLGPYAVRELRSIIEEAKWRKSRGEDP